MVQFSAADCYWQYLQALGVNLEDAMRSRVTTILQQTHWDTPQVAADCNNIAVIALIEADQCDDLATRSLYLEAALEVLNEGTTHPLCQAHLALLHSLMGNLTLATSIAFSCFIETLQAVALADPSLSAGLVYLPTHPQLATSQAILTEILQADQGYPQALSLLAEVLRRSQPIFYNPTGLRLLTLATQVLPRSAPILLKQGISSLVCQQWEGLHALHRARQIAPQDPRILQALYLAYRDLDDSETAQFWLTTARLQPLVATDRLNWQWTEAIAQPFTYVPFDQTLHLTVEASFRSIVTSVLVAEGDWFETELEFWRNQIQPGMTVIDVGANVGVYAFSAARQVGSTGRVLAVEPFAGCVQCLQETCRINALPWVTVCPGAASDRNGTAKLALQAASELNEVIIGETDPEGNFAEVDCFTLDSLVEKAHLDRVDFLKIDAEGHELQVLQGSDYILSTFRPVILYENIAGQQGSNRPVAEYLQAKGYRLFRYQPYVQQLIAIESLDDLAGNLNLLAILHDIPSP
jgi:FkbM family methyltransferase